MDPTVGRFISQDPSFWTIGKDKEQLANPQTQNSYSYAGNNPIKNIDPDGRCFWDACIGEATALVGLAVLYAPQITSFMQSLATPLGVVGLTEAHEQAQRGNYGWAAIGFVTAGEIPAGKAVVNGIETTADVASFLNKGNTATDVYRGIDQGKDVYVGISKNTAVREAQHGERFSNGLETLTNMPTRNQARAIEQTVMDSKGSSYQNIRNSISPNNPSFTGIKEWATNFMKSTGLDKK